MLLLKIFVTLILYIILFVIFLFTSQLLNFYINTLLFIVLIIFLAYQCIKKFTKRKTFTSSKRNFNYSLILFNLVFILLLTSYFSYVLNSYKYENKKLRFIHLLFDNYNDEYNETFKSIDYKNTQIFYTKEQELGLEIIKSYIDEATLFSKSLLGDFEVAPLKIKLDYDSKIFSQRKLSSDASGYYNLNTSTMYVLVEDLFKDLIDGFYFEDINDDISIMVDFHKTFLHEFNHHILYEFLKVNNIDRNKLPMWFIEGLAEFVGKNGAWSLPFEHKFFPLNTITSKSDWDKTLQAYEQAKFALDKVIYEGNQHTVKNILLNTATMTFEEAFEKTTGKSLSSFEKELKEDFDNGRDINSNYERTDYKRDKSANLSVLEKYLDTQKNDIEAFLYLSQAFSQSSDPSISSKSIEVLKYALKYNKDNIDILNTLSIHFGNNENFEIQKQIDSYIKSLN